MTPKMPSVAILGATGAVGQEFINLIEERNFPYSNLKLLASKRSAGKTMTVKGKSILLKKLAPIRLKVWISACLPAAPSVRNSHRRP